MRSVIYYFILFATSLSVVSCTCTEPHKEYVQNDFISHYSNYELISIENVEVSPPCFYWQVKYSESDSLIKLIHTETWQYWETGEKCYWKRVVIKHDSSYYPNNIL